MTPEIIQKHWLNPATPYKKRKKEEKSTTRKGRVIQGDKGIGRFAILKLGRKIEIISRREGEDVESVVRYDFSAYDDDFMSMNGEYQELYIDDLQIFFEVREPEVIKQGFIKSWLMQIKSPPYGKRIVISNLKGKWSYSKIDAIYRDLSRFESIFDHKVDSNDFEKSNQYQVINNQFEISLYKDDEPLPKR